MFSIPMDDGIKDTDFISIVILSYWRPDHTKRLLESIHKHKDSLVEIILFDDASPEKDQARIYCEMRHMISTIVFNTGYPLVNGGFSAAANRAVALANSRYILLLNNDLEMLNPGFETIKRALETPYVGCVGPSMGHTVSAGTWSAGDGVVVVKENDVAMRLHSVPHSSGLFAFRRDTWQAVGGFPFVYHNNADTAFHHVVLKHGLFNASIINSPQLFRNVDQDEGYVNATYGKTPFDQSYPHILGFEEKKFHDLCITRSGLRYQESHRQYRIPFGLNNIQSWSTYFKEACTEQGTYDWEKFSAYEQNKWREVVDAGIKRWRTGEQQ